MIFIKHFKRLISIAFVISVLVFAIRIVIQQSKNYSLQQIIDHLKEVPFMALFSAVIFIIINYLISSFYDFYALVLTKNKIPYNKILLGSFIGTSFGLNLGFPFFVGGFTRYRIYKKYLTGGFDIAKLMLIRTTTYWFGLIILLGLFMMTSVPMSNRSAPFFEKSSSHFNQLGLFLFIIPVLYCLLPIKYLKIPFTSQSFHLPSIPHRLLQGGIGIADVVTSGLIFYSLIAHLKISIIDFGSAYISGLMMSSVSGVPGGMGVFEAILLTGFADEAHKLDWIAALVFYRILLYFLPFIISLILFIVIELRTALKSK